jgi:hypothetical protein
MQAVGLRLTSIQSIGPMRVLKFNNIETVGPQAVIVYLHTAGPIHYLYSMLDEKTKTVSTYYGPHGDPARDDVNVVGFTL